MPSEDTIPANSRGAHDDAPLVTGLNALVWTLETPARAQRLLDLTGLTPEILRAGATDPAILGALLDFLASHEPDLIACAEAIGVTPTDLIRAREALQ
ncbi:MAG: DUF3572 domain-containing protein [Pseudomonadota bacterium]